MLFLFNQDFFHEGEYIIREGATGDTFFVVIKGQVGFYIMVTLPTQAVSNSNLLKNSSCEIIRK